MITKIFISEKLNLPLEEVDKIVEGLMQRDLLYFNDEKGYVLTEKGCIWKKNGFKGDINEI